MVVRVFYWQIDWRRVNSDLEKNAKKLQKKVEKEMTSSRAKSVSGRVSFECMLWMSYYKL